MKYQDLPPSLITADAVRYSIGIGSGLLWLAYFYLPRKGTLDVRL